MTIAELLTSIADKIASIGTNISSAYTKIADKGGTMPTEQTSENLANAIDSIPSGGGGGYTGHVDEVGLRAIGWETSDIEWLQANIDWMEEDDDAYKVPQELINIYTSNGGWSNDLLFAHKSKVYFKWSPKFDTTGITIDASHLRHVNAYYMIGMPRFEFMSRLGNTYNMFVNCYSLKFINTPTNASCSTLQLNNCYALRKFSILGSAGTSTNFTACYSLESIPDNTSGTQIKILNSPKLKNFKVRNCYSVCSFAGCPNMSKESMLYAINNASVNGATITLTAERYTTFSADADVIAALSTRTNVTIASE